MAFRYRLPPGDAKASILVSQLVRYAITGGFASVVNIGIFLYLRDKVHLDPNMAWTIGFLAAVVVGYIVHSRWSFRNHGRRDSIVRTGGRFFLASLVSFGLNSFWVWLAVTGLGLPTWAPIPAVLAVTPLAVFALNRKWVFA